MSSDGAEIKNVVLFVDETAHCQATLCEWAHEHGYTVAGSERYWGTAAMGAVREQAHLLVRTARDIPMGSLAATLRNLHRAGVALITLDDGQLAPDALERWITSGTLRTPPDGLTAR